MLKDVPDGEEGTTLFMDFITVKTLLMSLPLQGWKGHENRLDSTLPPLP
jgi:hypothetical protein